MDKPETRNVERIDDVLKKIERTRQARRHKFYLRDEKIMLSHGSGGKSTHNLIEGVFAPAFSNPLLDAMGSTNCSACSPMRSTASTYSVQFGEGYYSKIIRQGKSNKERDSESVVVCLSTFFAKNKQSSAILHVSTA